MAKVYGQWWGGHSYAKSIDVEDHLEVWDSIKDAKNALLDRYDAGSYWRQRFNWADGTSDNHFVPTVGRESYIDLYLYDPREGNNGPDRRIYFGPRGGVNVKSL